MRLKIASRASDLARIQAYQVARALKKVDPSIEIDFEFRSSLGDQNLDVPLASWGSKGVFTQDFFEDLKNDKFDLVVHSWKDLPTEAREGTKVVATRPRADVRDMILIPKSVWESCGEKLTLLSSSPRRSYNLREFEQFFPKKIKIEFQNVRGNVPTRIEKMFSENAGLILAKAAVDRLLTAPVPEFAETQKRMRERIGECRFMILPVALNPPAAAQGALAIEIKQGRTDLETLARKINDRATFDNVLHERTTLKSYGGGCHQKIGVANIDKPFGRWHVLKGLTDQGKVLDVETLTTENQLPKAHSRENIFPQSTGDNNWFERKPIKAQIPANHALWVAKADAWPEGLKSEAIIWTSGMNSWRKLAEKGVWVNGCAENLGDESPQLEALVPEIKWVKLTHSQADGDGTVVTYALVPKSQDKSPCLKDKTHFYWMSGSSFKRAYELFPEELARGFHGCGPGLTFQQLSQEKRIRPPQIFLNLEAFLKAVLPP